MGVYVHEHTRVHVQTHMDTCSQAHMHTHGNVEEGVTETWLG